MKDQSTVEVRLDVPYGGGVSGTLCSDLYLPKKQGPHPALLCLHGGAWLRGSQRQYKIFTGSLGKGARRPSMYGETDE
jgi:acetyl esterase/lipase